MLDRKEFLTHGVHIAIGALLPVIIINIALGMVVGVQLAPGFVDHGMGANLGIISARALTREVSPILGSMMIATQYGTGIAAEVANMKITEQVDALKVFRVDPFQYLFIPRVVAVAVFAPIIVFISALFGLASTYLTSWWLKDLALESFMRTIQSWFEISDMYLCLFKSMVFGIIIVSIAVILGLRTRGGAKEVGDTTTLTVITSFIAVIIADYIITTIYL